MPSDERTPLQRLLAEHIEKSSNTRDYYDTLLRKKLRVTSKPLWDIERGKVKRPSPRILRAIEEVMSLSGDSLVDLVHPREHASATIAPDLPPARDASAGELVQITQLDLSLPMGSGATVDDYIEEEPRTFDLAYIRAFTRTPPHRLRIAHGVGDSMFPTLQSADLVWIDSTQTTLNQADRIWAVSINGAAAIKRLRRMKPGRVLVVSDNPAVENYEVDEEDIRIGGRVIRFARDV